MRTFNLDNAIEFIRRQAMHARLGYRRAPRRRQRDPTQWEVLLEMDRARLRKAEADGKRIRLGSRHWRLT